MIFYLKIRLFRLMTVFYLSYLVMCDVRVPLTWETCLKETSFRTILDTTLPACAAECLERVSCKSLSYSRRLTACILNNNDTETETTQDCGGFVYTEKRRWGQMVASCSPPCPSNTKCDVITGTCRIEECKAPPVIDPEVSFGNRVQVGSKVKVICADSKSTKLHLSCHDDGTWGGTILKCPIECRAPPMLPLTSLMEGEITVGSERRYLCDDGYGAASPNESDVMTVTTCLTSGMWSPVNFQCLRDCKDPGSINQTTLSPGGTVVGSQRSYECVIGYVVRSPDSKPSQSTTLCLQSGHWSNVHFICIRDCAEPGTISDASVLPGETTENVTRIFQCNQGYLPMPVNGSDVNMTITCLESGNWTEVQFQCARDCTDPPNVSNAITSPGGTTVGSQRSYICAYDYVAVPVTNGSVAMETTCLSSGLWSSMNFQCLIDCLQPDSVQNAILSPGGTLEGSQRSYGCDVEYAAIPLGSITDPVVMMTTCMATGAWSPTDFKCVLINTLGQGCSADVECLEENSRCLEGVCFCNQLYEYNADLRACVQVCSSYGDSWSVTYNYNIIGYNHGGQGFISSLSDCQQACLDLGDECPTLDWNINECYLNLATRQQVLDSNPFALVYGILHFYERDCIPA